MSQEPTPPSADSAEAASPAGPLGRRSALARVGHVLFWTLLFYLLTYGIAKLCEWLSRL